MKNNYSEVKVWNYPQQRFIKTGLQFCGLIMGDHSKTGINTMLNTGTVIGVSANVFGGGFPRNYIPSYAWGGSAGFSTYRTDKAFETMERMMARRNVDFDTEERLIMLRVFEDTAKYRPVGKKVDRQFNYSVLPRWKRWLSYFWTIPIESVQSEVNPDLHVSLIKGRFQLYTQHAIYSFDDLYDNFGHTFSETKPPIFTGRPSPHFGLWLR